MKQRTHIYSQGNASNYNKRAHMMVEFNNKAPRNKSKKKDCWDHDHKQRQEYGPYVRTEYKSASEAEFLQEKSISKN